MNSYVKPKFYMEPDFKNEQGIAVESVGDYILNINKIIKDVVLQENSGRTEILLFRGQKTDFWPVNPSIFRDNYLSVEHDLLQQPLEKLPHEFKYGMDIFEMMEKCQHYGLCTRLIDLTTNPLVALYFACATFGDVEYRMSLDESGEEKEPYGIVYYKWDYPLDPKSSEVQIISALARMNLNQNGNLVDVLNSLYKQSVISKKELEKWRSNDGYKEFIKVIQSDYIVRPIYSNDRLIKQSGMFMLASCFNVYGDDPSNIIIGKGESDFKKTFDGFFYIDGNIKNTIIQELDRYSINESTLFPELEHQLNYIKESTRGIENSPQFIKFEEILPAIREESVLTNALDVPDFEEQVKQYLNNEYEMKLSNDLWNDIKETIQIVDWYQRDSIKSALLMKMTKKFKTYGMKENAKNAAREIWEFISRVSKGN